ncbi:MAG: acetyl-CoA carboxylase carboxyltransferase subunit alpha [Rhabdochlamydiaceae bacterium]|nr:acetyl-CoA carboxylase carboxyltransferase subunit alpha [Rhabdochlamydiaceae bacterium]
MLPHEKQILEYEKMIAKLKDQDKDKGLWSEEEIHKLEGKLHQLKAKVYAELTPWERVAICRHPARPRSIDYIRNICDEFTEIFGDRLFRDDPSIIAGFAKIGGVKFMVIGQEKGCDTESRLQRNFGMPHPEGYRKAMRCMRLAEKFKLPVLSLLDTPGAYPGLAAEERGQGWAIAQNLLEMARLKTPIVILLIGEGCSGGALGMGIGDVIGMLEHSYYSVISPEGCASILWKDTSKNEVAAEALKMHVEDLLELGIVDDKIDEPLGGAHHDTAEVYRTVKNYVVEQWNLLKGIPPEDLIERRYQKFRRIGKFIVEDKTPVL